MKEYEFTLKFSLGDEASDPESYIERLAEAGCDDALIGIGQQGRIAFNFNREAESALSAVCSAIKNIKSVIPEATLVEATPDFVGISDIADILGYSRQNIRKLMMNHRASFPAPIHEGKSAIWHLSSVLTWFKDRKDYPVDELLFDVTQANMQLNIAKENFYLDPVVNTKIHAMLS